MESRCVLWAAVVLFITTPVFAAKKPKQPKPPSQPAITQECITVYDIYSHSLGILSGIGAPEPGLDAKIQSSCQVAA